MIRFATVSALALAVASLGIQPAEAAHHEAVSQVVSVKVKPGKLEKYKREVKKLMGVMQRLGSAGRVRMWQATAAGPDTGTILVAIEHPTAAAWAASDAKVQGDAEWQKIVSGLDKLRDMQSNSIWRDISPTPVQARAGGSGVLAIIGVQVKPGKLDRYRKRLERARRISDRLGIGGDMRIWQAELAGPNSGAVAVGLEYDDVADYVAAQGKLATDAEWRQFISGLADMRTLTGRWLYQEITP